MSKRFPVALILLLLLCHSGAAQQARRELRGIWLTTLLGLDWPAASLRGKPQAQQQALREKLDDLQSRNFNTVFFQVRSRGNAMYRSALEPWASELTGKLGRDPGWDPLAFAIRETHARGMSLHAWFNVSRIWSKGRPAASTPAHVARAHPDWVQRHGDDLWIDPGIPEARSYTIRVMEDLVRNYAVDGIHFDYCRYPDRDFKDADTYSRYGKGMPKADWRRGNINALVREAYQKLIAIRPSLQVGSAPIGIYENLPGARGWEGRNAIFQDSRRWLQDGYHDYVVPQIYWGLKRRGSRIDFRALVKDWKAHSGGRHVYAGVAAYKDHVKPWLHEHVDACRDLQADGVVFFREEHVRRDDLGGRFNLPALLPAMSWRDNIRPNPPLNVRFENAIARWDAPVPAADGDAAAWFALYGFRGEQDTRGTLLKVLPADADHTPLPPGYERYALTALDAFHNESGTADETVVLAEAEELSAPSITVPGPRISTPQPAGDDLILLGYELWQSAFVRLRLMDGEGAEVMVLVDGLRDPGTYVIGIERSRLPHEVRRHLFEAGDMRTIMDFSLTETD